jgi:hypothetical protein
MQKQSILVNNNKYAVYKDNDDVLYPANRIEEYEVIQTSLVANTLKTITFTDMDTSLRLEEFYFYSSTGASNKPATFRAKDGTGNTLCITSFPTNAHIINIAKIILLPDYTIEITAIPNVEVVRMQFRKVGNLTVKNK